MLSMGRWRATISTRKRALRQALFSVHGQLCCHRPERQSMRTETASRTPLWPASIIPASAFRSQCSARLVSAAPVARVRAASRLSPARTRTPIPRSEEHTSELQSPMGISYAVFCLKKKKANKKAHELEILTDKNTTQTNEKLTT